MRRAHTVLAVVVAIAAQSGLAHADQQRVLVLPFSGSVPNAPDGTQRLTQVVARAAGLTGAEVVIGQATFADAATLAGCSEETPECFKQLADSLKVNEVVIGDVAPSADGASVTITLKHFQDGQINEKSLTVSGSIDEMVKRVAREVPRLMVSGGETSETPPDRIPATTTPVAGPVPAAPAPERDTGRPGRIGTLPWVLMGTGVALAGAGGGFLFMAKKKQDDVDGAPIHNADDFERLVDLEDKGDRYTKIGQGLLIGGGAVLATGVVWALVRRASGSEETDEPSIAVQAAPLDGGAGFVVGREW
jgi:hypothetical protein